MSEWLLLFPKDKVSTAIWDMKEGRSMGVLEGHTSMVRTAEINHLGDMAATSAGDHDEASSWSIKIWNLGTMQCTADLSSTDYTSTFLQDRLLLGSADGTIKVWDIGGSTPVALMDLVGHDGKARSISSSEISSTVLTGSVDKSVRLWDLRTSQCVRVIMKGHKGVVNSVSMDSACRNAVSGSDDRTAKLWDLGSGRCIRTHQYFSAVHSVMMHESGSSFLVTSDDMSFTAYSTASGYDDPILHNNLSYMCRSGSSYYPSIVASRDLSSLGVCYLKDDAERLGVSVWK